MKDAIFGTVTVNDIEQPVGGGANLGTTAFHGNTSLAAVVGVNDQDQLQLFYAPGFFVNVAAASADPTIAPGRQARTGSLLLVHLDDATGGAYVKVGPLATDWQKVAG